MKTKENQMFKKLAFVLIAVLALSFALSACGPAATPQTVVPTQIVEVTSTPGSVAPATPTPLPAGSVQINGAGATFPLPVYTQWTYAFQYVDSAVVINYQGVGSGAGKTAILDNTVDFAGSDSLLNDDQYTQGVDLQMYPMLAGAVVNIYNIKWTKEIPSGTTLPALILDRQTLVGIYNAKITTWNDPAIVALNPGLADYLPATKMTVVHRSDGSGTTEIFTKALTSFGPDWTAGGASSVEWPVDKAGNGIGGKGNQGVTAAVLNTTGSIGYVELSYAKSNNMAFASMINKASKTVVANAASVEAAMAEFATTFTDKLTTTIVDGSSDSAWPIAGYTYIILHTTSMTDCVKAQKLLEFLQWAQTDAGAQAAAASLGYSVLPEAVRQTVLAKLAEVTCNGQTVLK
jgi:phosphate transport system substrate-binding protein